MRLSLGPFIRTYCNLKKKNFTDLSSPYFIYLFIFPYLLLLLLYFLLVWSRLPLVSQLTTMRDSSIIHVYAQSSQLRGFPRNEEVCTVTVTCALSCDDRALIQTQNLHTVTRTRASISSLPTFLRQDRWAPQPTEILLRFIILSNAKKKKK